MRVIAGLVALAAFAIGAVFFYAKIDGIRENARIEARNDRITASNRVIEAIGTLDDYSRECTDWLVGLTTGTFEHQQLTPRTALTFAQTCDTQMISSADKVQAAIVKSEAATEAENALAFFTAARDLTAAYRAQSEDFGRAADLLTTAKESGADLSGHQGAVADLVNRRLPAINEGLAALDEARRAFIYPDDA
ncbi:hypothetical protein K1T73_10115 [Roseovarius sp. SCSIO 43702]|uniref:hypothetical protein n=1 Tax=Roseovarius sp. SCSIO 43702 TaxID=2823043 RepID=UPI001C737879|nr:hypothetical protein [Roseovarius sp. SCSIO 43702]QYX55463.1 hypothetical protein K1T73_10115 [Roseovarius sp. SCSIO 43702]